MKAARGAGLLVILGMIVGGMFGAFRFGIGTGDGTGDGTGEGQTPPVAEVAAPPSPSPAVVETPEVLVVRIEGSRYLVDDQAMPADRIAEMAASRTNAAGESDPATVKIQRAPDATRGAREALVEELRRRNLLYQVE